MRAALWLVALFAVAVALALFAGNNQGTVTVYWPPFRVDLSLNLVVLLLALLFFVLHLALQALGALTRIPQQARNWRLLQKERAIHTTLLESLTHLISGRFVRARKTAEMALALEESVERSGERLPYGRRLRALSHLLAAESAHALQDRTVRDSHFQQALQHTVQRDTQDAREGVQLRGARWALDDRDAPGAMQWLDQLPVGASRRTVALRLRFRAARLAGKSRMALDTARLLTKHHAFSDVAGRSIARGLAIELLRNAYDPTQIAQAWDCMERSEQSMPEVAVEAAERLLAQGGDAAQARQWVLPAWEQVMQRPDAMGWALRVRLARVLERSFMQGSEPMDTAWLTRVEAAQAAYPGDAVLQYLAGVVCMRLGLWGKAQQMLKQALFQSQQTELRRDTWLALAQLAEQTGDAQAAAEAYRQAAKRVTQD